MSNFLLVFNIKRTYTPHLTQNIQPLCPSLCFVSWGGTCWKGFFISRFLLTQPVVARNSWKLTSVCSGRTLPFYVWCCKTSSQYVMEWHIRFCHSFFLWTHLSFSFGWNLFHEHVGRTKPGNLFIQLAFLKYLRNESKSIKKQWVAVTHCLWDKKARMIWSNAHWHSCRLCCGPEGLVQPAIKRLYSQR